MPKTNICNNCEKYNDYDRYIIRNMWWGRIGFLRLCPKKCKKWKDQRKKAKKEWEKENRKPTEEEVLLIYYQLDENKWRNYE